MASFHTSGQYPITLMIAALLVIMAQALGATNVPDPLDVEEQRKICQKAKENANGWQLDCEGDQFKHFAHKSPEERKRLAGVIHPPEEVLKKITSIPPEEDVKNVRQKRQITIPTSFDARQNWPACSNLISKIRDQSGCGSCWAVSSADSITDRACITNATKGLTVGTDSTKVQNYYSALELLSCVPSNWYCNGCTGGYPYYALYWAFAYGLVTGTDYTMAGGCKPYPFPSGGGTYSTPSCSAQCTNGAYTPSYPVMGAGAIVGGGGRIKPSSATRWYNPAVSSIQSEIMARGSVVNIFDLYEDFYYYKSGVYQHVTGSKEGQHAVRCFGWGVQANADGTQTPYWLCANQWGNGWGENGLFKILRGSNHALIESEIAFATIP